MNFLQGLLTALIVLQQKTFKAPSCSGMRTAIRTRVHKADNPIINMPSAVWPKFYDPNQLVVDDSRRSISSLVEEGQIGSEWSSRSGNPREDYFTVTWSSPRTDQSASKSFCTVFNDLQS